MKKIYLCIALSVSLFAFASKTFTQEMLSGINMEEADGNSWSTSKLNQSDGNTVTYTFGYTDDKPSAGTGGCLYVTGTNAGTAENPLTNFIFYQQVTLQKGITYTFDGAYKDNRTNNYWTEVYWGGKEPEIGSDYGTDQDAVFVSGFKSTNWETNCTSDVFDGTFQKDACTPGTTNSILIEGEGDTTIFFGFRIGIWDDGANGYTFEVLLDNISLKGPESGSSLRNLTTDVSVFPTPVVNTVTVKAGKIIRDVQVIDLLGKTVFSKDNISSDNVTINLSFLMEGIYYIKITDITGKSFITKTLKIKEDI